MEHLSTVDLRIVGPRAPADDRGAPAPPLTFTPWMPTHRRHTSPPTPALDASRAGCGALAVPGPDQIVTLGAGRVVADAGTAA
jgi:hypothetical protein